MVETPKSFYGSSYEKAADFAEGKSASLYNAYRFFGMALRAEESKDETSKEKKISMSLGAAIKHEAVAFPGS
jgi:hypothetical protein